MSSALTFIEGHWSLRPTLIWQETAGALYFIEYPPALSNAPGTDILPKQNLSEQKCVTRVLLIKEILTMGFRLQPLERPWLAPLSF